MIKVILPILFTGGILTACDSANHSTDKNSQTVAAVSTAGAISADAMTIAVKNPTDSKIQINWAKIDSNEPVADKATFKYTIALDSLPVKNYVNLYHVDAKTAQYNLTVGMAVNEPLSKILDQIGTSYVSHELTAGDPSKFIIHTTQKVAPSEHIYVFSEPFAKGLSIPIQLIPDGKK